MAKKAKEIGSLQEIARPPPHSHRGEPVRIGPYSVRAGGTMYLQPEDFEGVDILVALTSNLPRLYFGEEIPVLAAILPDFGGVPEFWERFLKEQMIPLLDKERVLVYCAGSHGRTGTFLASLIALVEDPADTPDPIAAVRGRHCDRAVETLAQAEAIFALRGEPLPEKYRQEFTPRVKLGPKMTLESEKDLDGHITNPNLVSIETE